VRVSAEELPDGKVGDEEELERAEENGAADAENTAAILEPSADEHAEQEAGIDHGNEAVEADEKVSGKEGHERGEKRDAAIAKHRAGKERHGTDWREIPRVRHDAHDGGEDNHYGGENGAKHENVRGQFFLVHDSSETSF
jgi:hypothetical protein